MLNAAKLLPLVKYAGMTSDKLTTTVLGEVAGAFGLDINANDANLALVAEAMRTGNVSTLSDLIGRPDVFVPLTKKLAPPEERLAVTRKCVICESSITSVITPACETRGYGLGSCLVCGTINRILPDGVAVD